MDTQYPHYRRLLPVARNERELATYRPQAQAVAAAQFQRDVFLAHSAVAQTRHAHVTSRVGSYSKEKKHV